jgi:1-acyl-sn-glycerol-3-phosphate acyltransferase
MSPFRHFVSGFTLAAGLANLTFWSLPLLALLLVSLVFPSSRPRLQAPLADIYRAAVRVNDWWFRHVLGYRWQPPEFPIDPERSYLVIANHQSWADSLLLQMVIVHKGPILKVLVKEELARWPLLGLIFAIYDFPRLQRRAAQPTDEPERKRQDAERIREACAVLKRSPAAMLIYPEGTRYTPAKHRASAAAADYQHLLAPRPGGFATVLEATEDIVETVLDVTISYPDSTNFWAFLSGGIREPEVRVTEHAAAPITDPSSWLRERWRDKDDWLMLRGAVATAQHESN